MGRVCTKCGTWKPAEEFSLKTKYADGINSQCKECVRAWARALNYQPDPSLVEKGCSKCGEVLPIANFRRNKATKTGYNSWCNDCESAGMRWRHYNVTKEWYQAAYKRQDGRCAICGDETPLFVDHDHECCPGARSCGLCVRGLICRSCNTGLGNFRDDPDLLDNAATYVIENQPWRGGGST